MAEPHAVDLLSSSSYGLRRKHSADLAMRMGEKEYDTCTSMNRQRGPREAYSDFAHPCLALPMGREVQCVYRCFGLSSCSNRTVWRFAFCVLAHVSTTPDTWVPGYPRYLAYPENQVPRVPGYPGIHPIHPIYPAIPSIPSMHPSHPSHPSMHPIPFHSIPFHKPCATYQTHSTFSHFVG